MAWPTPLWWPSLKEMPSGAGAGRGRCGVKKLLLFSLIGGGVCFFLPGFIPCFFLANGQPVLGFLYNRVHAESATSAVLLTVDEVAYCHQVGHGRLVGVFYDPPTGSGGADVAFL